ncbi:juvenile hormone esterase-like [Pieris brassicae]|uniref:juvenile hormone esterase-like n=1 Tax=Pieris brassicae TaxID=7116 RepID=UPI001E661F58|nr:juvenile hormone esterase-like [Pieris brassicae]
MSRNVISVITVLCVAFGHVSTRSTECDVQTRIESGLICGSRRWAGGSTVYASFRGVPYAKQPLGELRFKELQSAEPWDGYLDTLVEGPICPQHDVLYGRLMQPRNMSEACIHANIHVPIHALPGSYQQKANLPIFVFVHGGGLAFGSGDSDLHGPEYLVQREMIVITFNYRLNVFGYLSLNSTSIPGNNGLRDIITLLRWVKANAKCFGGNPEDITLGGQSAGALNVHLLTLSKAAEGLFNKAILMSGTAISSFYTSSPIYAQFVAKLFLTSLGINTTDAEEAHHQLTQLPIEQIMQANKLVQDQIGMTAFFPVVETTLPGVTTIIDDDPAVLLANGVGRDLPLLVGFTSAECETFRTNFDNLDMLARIQENPLMMLPIDLIYKLPPKVSLASAQKLEKRYFNKAPTMDKYVNACSDMFYVYPALQLAKMRMSTVDAAAMFLYQFSYDAVFNVIEKAMGIRFDGAAHIEDLTFIFRTNSLQNWPGFSPPANEDRTISVWMTNFVQNFMNCNEPTCEGYHVWPSVNQRSSIHYQNIQHPQFYRYEKITQEQLDMMQFFEELYNKTQT